MVFRAHQPKEIAKKIVVEVEINIYKIMHNWQILFLKWKINFTRLQILVVKLKKSIKWTIYIILNSETFNIDILHWLKSELIELILYDILLSYTAILSDNLIWHLIPILWHWYTQMHFKKCVQFALICMAKKLSGK